jgi:hypothetical protein
MKPIAYLSLAATMPRSPFRRFLDRRTERKKLPAGLPRRSPSNPGGETASEARSEAESSEPSEVNKEEQTKIERARNAHELVSATRSLDSE